MNTPIQPPIETALQKERRLFNDLFYRLIDTLLHNIFDLRPEKAQRRMRYLVILLLISGVIITLIYYPLKLWTGHVQDIFLYLLNPAYAASYLEGDPFTKFINMAIQALTDPHILQYLPIFVAPFFIAQQLAAFYLADIFELEDISVARHFVSEVALSGSDEIIRIAQGKIVDQHLESPNYLIGGPGKVIVELDSIALFERADGTSHVIGPTGRQPGGRATIDGFERFRQAIDIRDHLVELRDQDERSESVKSRSRDGIPITATDVRLVFSIYRGENPQPSADFPYPFSPDAIERIVYNSTSRVTPDQNYPSSYEFSWTGNMIGLIRSKLSRFMGEKRLTEYLASIGVPELEKAKQREEQIEEQVRRLTQPAEDPKVKSSKPAPSFTPRHEITNLFSQFTEDFTKGARNNGVELHWIGVGTWKTPPEIDVVSEKHLEAWKLSQENLKTGNPDAMKRVESDATLQKMQALIQNVPIEAYNEILGASQRKQSPGKPAYRKSEYRPSRETSSNEDMLFSEDDMMDLFQEPVMINDLTKRFNEKVDAAVEKKLRESDKESDRRLEMRELLMEYRNQLLESVQFMKAKNEPVPQVIDEAIKYINLQMGFRHWAGSS